MENNISSRLTPGALVSCGGGLLSNTTIVPVSISPDRMIAISDFSFFAQVKYLTLFRRVKDHKIKNK